MKKFIIAFALQIVAASLLNAQQIKGTVKDEKGKLVSAATVSLLQAHDTSVVKLAITNEGVYSFEKIQPGSFLISISYVGYQTVFSEKFTYQGQVITVPEMVLAAPAGNLQAITVVARKPVIEVKANKTILNVEGTINATGTDALELLRKSPGVMVDNDEKLSINGKNGVRVYIDNKPTPLNGQDLSSYLKSIPAAQIEAIEIINNPSVSYEAGGSAGIINIRMKKNKAIGFNGSVNAGVSISQNARYDAGFSLNYRSRKVNVFGTYNYNRGKIQSEFSLHRVVLDTAFDQQNRIEQQKNSHHFKTGLDYTLNAKSTIGVMVNGSFSNPTIINLNITPISHYPTGKVDRILAAGNFNRQKNNNINANANYNYKDSRGRSLIVNGDYGYYSIRQNQVQPNYFFDVKDSTELYHRNYVIVSPTAIDIYSLKADYEQNFAKGRLGIGGKTGYVKTNNDFNQYNADGDKIELDKDRSNFFGYKENVNALYVSYSRELQGFTIQGGLRAEQTALKGNLRGYKKTGVDYTNDYSSFSQDYIDFFPNVTVTISPKAQNQFALAYSRRIDRPVYQDLNPFEYRINEYTFHKGSIELRPQYTNTVSLAHTYKFKLNTTLSYSHVKDMFGQVVDTAQGVKGFLLNRNFASQDITSLNISYPFQYKKYSLFTNVNTYYSKYKANDGTNRNINLAIWAVNIYAQNSFRFGKGWTAELSGFYTSPSIWQGSLKTASMWSADAGIQKQVLKGKATIKTSVSDVFKTLKWSATSYFAGQDVAVAGSQDSRQFKLNFTYRFGNNQVKAARQYKTGAEEENNRTKSNGGLGH